MRNKRIVICPVKRGCYVPSDRGRLSQAMKGNKPEAMNVPLVHTSLKPLPPFVPGIFLVYTRGNVPRLDFLISQ